MKKLALPLIGLMAIMLLILWWPKSHGLYKVVSVTDGDTIIVLSDSNEQLKVRLAEIDCPERRQAFGTKAKEALAEKVFGKHVRLEWTKKDRYGRIVGKVYLDDRYINLEMVQEGWAWHYTEYSHSHEIADAQVHARKNRLGLWADAHPVAPWEFRKRK